MSEEIDRWILAKDGDYAEMEFSEHGAYVLYQDHLAELDELTNQLSEAKKDLRIAYADIGGGEAPQEQSDG